MNTYGAIKLANINHKLAIDNELPSVFLDDDFDGNKFWYLI